MLAGVKYLEYIYIYIYIYIEYLSIVSSFMLDALLTTLE